MDKEFLEPIIEMLLPERMGETLQKDGQHKAAITEKEGSLNCLKAA